MAPFVRRSTYGVVQTLKPTQTRPNRADADRSGEKVSFLRKNDFADGQRQRGDEENADTGQHQNEDLSLNRFVSIVVSLVVPNVITLMDASFAQTNGDGRISDDDEHEKRRNQTTGENLRNEFDRDARRNEEKKTMFT